MKIAVFASGNGSNAENIIRYFRAHPECGIDVALVVCNKADAPVLRRASALGVESRVVVAKDFRNGEIMLPRP